MHGGVLMFGWIASKLLGWQPTILVLGIAVATASVVGGYGGYKLASWQCRANQLAAAEQYNRELEAALTDYAKEARAQQAKAVLAAIEQQRRTSAVGDVLNEVRNDPDAACVWSDADRLRFQRLYEIYGQSATARPGDLPDAVQRSTESTGRSPQDSRR